jgi:hypothetical protein
MRLYFLDKHVPASKITHDACRVKCSVRSEKKVGD